ncbi:MAG: hypothetical protein ACREWG_00340 [Gammaproteobacteria bacterium]
MSGTPNLSAARGVVYVATRNDGYVILAAASAQSVRRYAPQLPIALFTNVLQIPGPIAQCFDRVETIASPRRIDVDWANGLIDKIHGIRHTPYEHTFFIDADTVCRSGEIMQAFAWLEDYDLLITECAEDASLSRRLIGRPLYSTGIMAYRKSQPVMDLCAAWMEFALECIEYVRRKEFGRLPGLDGLNSEQKAFLALTDQYSLAKFLSPEVNSFSLKVKLLEERWNFRGDGKRTPPSGLVIDHQMEIKQGRRTVEA